jgi:hypothetical protein
MTTRPTSDSERLARLERICASLALQTYGAASLANGIGLDPHRLRQQARFDAAAIVSEQNERLETRRAAA